MRSFLPHNNWIFTIYLNFFLTFTFYFLIISDNQLAVIVKVPSFIFIIPRTRLARDERCRYKSCWDCLFANLNHKKKKKKKHSEQPAWRPATIKGKRKRPLSPQETSALLLALCLLILSMMHFSHGRAKHGVDLEIKEAGAERANQWWAGLRRQPGGDWRGSC